MTAEPITPKPLYRCVPFTVGRDGAIHLWSWHDLLGTVAEELQADKHAHYHANGLADHTHTDQPETGQVTA